METGMSDGSVPGPSWDPEPGRAYYSRPYWEYECHFGFPSSSSEKTAATKWRYDMIVLKMYIGLIPRLLPPPPPSEEWGSLVSRLYFSHLWENGSGQLPISFSFKCAGRVNNLLVKCT